MLALSLPSVTTRITFLSFLALSFRWLIDMRTASRMAVPPRESILVRACSIFWTSLVKSQSRKASSLKFTTNTSSSAFEALTNANAAAATF